MISHLDLTDEFVTRFRELELELQSLRAHADGAAPNNEALRNENEQLKERLERLTDQLAGRDAELENARRQIDKSGTEILKLKKKNDSLTNQLSEAKSMIQRLSTQSKKTAQADEKPTDSATESPNHGAGTLRCPNCSLFMLVDNEDTANECPHCRHVIPGQ